MLRLLVFELTGIQPRNDFVHIECMPHGHLPQPCKYADHICHAVCLYILICSLPPSSESVAAVDSCISVTVREVPASSVDIDVGER